MSPSLLAAPHTQALSKVPLFAPPPLKHGSILPAHGARCKARSVAHNGHANSNELQAAFQKLTEPAAQPPLHSHAGQMWVCRGGKEGTPRHVHTPSCFLRAPGKVTAFPRE